MPKLLPPEEILALLAAGPERLALCTDGLTEAQLHAAPSEGEWSANDVLAHIRACQDVWSALITAIRAGRRVPRNVIHPRTYIKQTDYLDLDFAQSLQAFTDGRKELMANLSAMPVDAWAALGPARGWTLVCGRPLLDQANGVALHEASHVQQIESTVNALRREETRQTTAVKAKLRGFSPQCP